MLSNLVDLQLVGQSRLLLLRNMTFMQYRERCPERLNPTFVF